MHGTPHTRVWWPTPFSVSRFRHIRQPVRVLLKKLLHAAYVICLSCAASTLPREASMTDIALPGSIEPARRRRPDLDRGFHPASGIIFLGIIAAALLYVGYSIYADIEDTGARVTTYLPFILLLVALLIALAFEFVNGFHDTANAVATVIYTRALPANFAVVWSGMFNLLGVLLSTGAVAFGIVS